MSGILERIEKNYSKFTKSEKKVADYIFENPRKVLYTSITDLALNCKVGDTTVFRFCKELKLNGYQEFKVLLAQDITKNEGNKESVAGIIEVGDDTRTICEKTLSAHIESLKETFELLDFEQAGKTVDLMSAARKIHFFGVGSSGAIALEAKQKFMRIIPNVEFTGDTHMQHMAASLLDSRDLAVIFSYSGSTKDMIEIHKLVKQNGCPSVIITHFAKTALTADADIVLLCGSNEGPLDGGASTTSVVQLYVLEVLYLQYFIKHYNQCMENKARTTESISTKLL
ncbi:MurR/RpiR family transcriptional regulator [Anaerocolumna chitinilytica]|uniref:Putative HTH-type transcriptional regulator n=1 Tax=Anaerocolumna chitinilytica TaxID=1727145 RepID=A0A7I8DLU4_9FIRM|nr:MurR/RpiR family transcriptional regulator [Anaerocolumna chitinilytica]BCJ99388.1 putative HTH-type transcriptional regulator [Anaerocolumna chitinilytica]